THLLSGEDFQLLRPQFLNDIARRLLRVVRLTDGHYHEAEQLLRRHGLTHSLRTSDALQLAVALNQRRRGMLDAFVCADQNLCHPRATFPGSWLPKPSSHFEIPRIWRRTVWGASCPYAAVSLVSSALHTLVMSSMAWPSTAVM